MDEFWALVIGAVLATAGGIIGTLFSNFIDKRKERKNKKTEAYIKTLNFLHKVKFKSFKGNSLNETSEIFTILNLYATDDIKMNFSKVMSKIVQFRQETVEDSTKREKIEELIEYIAVLIKKELSLLLNKSDKELFKTIMEKTEDNNAN